MEKIIYLSKKLKAFTFDEIFLLAEMEKENLEKCLNELMENGTLKQDTHGYIYVEQIPAMIKDIIQSSNSKKQKTENFGIFIPNNIKTENLSFLKIVNKFLEEYVTKFCKISTVKTYKFMFKNHIIPYFKNKDLENICADDIMGFFYYCQEKQLSPKRIKNTLALLKQFLSYAKNNGFIDNTCNFQVKRLSVKNEFDLNRVTFERGIC